MPPGPEEPAPAETAEGHAVRIRAALATEAAELTELVLRSKAYWGYDEAFLRISRRFLTLRADQVAARRTRVAERDGRPVGVATLDGDPPEGELGLLFVDPDAIGQGVGRSLFGHVTAMAGRLGFSRLRIESDPNAEPFYLAMGAERIGTIPSGVRAGRDLPLLIKTVGR